MNKPLKQQVVILATLLGIDDKDITRALNNCDDALKRHGLIQQRGRPSVEKKPINPFKKPPKKKKTKSKKSKEPLLPTYFNDLGDAKLQLQQSEYYLKEIERFGEESGYFKTKDKIERTIIDANDYIEKYK